jgi:hypothetical protein
MPSLPVADGCESGRSPRPGQPPVDAQGIVMGIQAVVTPSNNREHTFVLLLLTLADLGRSLARYFPRLRCAYMPL